MYISNVISMIFALRSMSFATWFIRGKVDVMAGTFVDILLFLCHEMSSSFSVRQTVAPHYLEWSHFRLASSHLLSQGGAFSSNTFLHTKFALPL